ncbi:MAG TPA: serine/threonine-protein kinase [Pirellulaceae bacterium]|nr:serine/threonine protein kinase [Planctomycetales bacterium]MCB9939230.1 serine/threonine protein kinase [Planctomycetaceae bacterium]HRX78044.1 serine/threonine-protein kinase [Pirellulaceae bacterium]
MSPSRISAAPPLERIEHFQLVRHLGRGGFADVFLARDQELGRDVAIKIPRSDRYFSDHVIEMFREEARVAASLRHPSIVNILQVGKSDACPCFIVMEYVEGESLATLMANQTVDCRPAIELVTAVADAVQYAHSQGVVHRDIKPNNILVSKAGRPIILDFGLGLRDEVQWDRSTEIAGTPAYMPPEQIKGDLRAIDGRADVWSLGVMLYRMLAGRLPFGGRADIVFSNTLSYDPKPIRQFNPSIPVELEAITLRCLAQSPVDRYATAKDLADALREWSNSTETTINAPSRTKLLRRPLLRLAAVMAACLLFAAGLVAVGDRNATRSPEAEDGAVSKAVNSNLLRESVEVRPNAWNNYLSQPPKPFLFPDDVAASHWSYDARRESLHLTCGSYGLIEVGTLDVPDCLVRVEISKNFNGGKSGLYFGCFDTIDNQRNIVSYCQAVVVECTTEGRRLLTRERYHFVRKQNGSYYSNSQSFCAKDVTVQPNARVIQDQLQLHFRDNVLREVDWNGQRVEELTDETATGYVDSTKLWRTMHLGVPDTKVGGFGCINGLGDATFEMLFVKPLVLGE